MSGVRIGEVYSVEDPLCAGRIKVFIKGEDNSLSLETNGQKDKMTELLDYAFPLLPKMLHVMPKVGELVFVLVDDDKMSRRYYIGPIISQDKFMFEDLTDTADSMLTGGQLAPSKPDSIGGVDNDTVPHVVYPKTDDITIEGRRNCGVQIKDNSLMVKAGVKAVNPNKFDDVKLNDDNTQAYMLLTYNDSGETPSEENLEKDFKSTATIVADKINLLGNRAEKMFDLTNKDELITNEEMKSIIDEASRVPLGDKLVEFLELFVSAFVHHTHPLGNIEPVCTNTDVEKVKNFDISSILSKNIRIN